MKLNRIQVRANVQIALRNLEEGLVGSFGTLVSDAYYDSDPVVKRGPNSVLITVDNIDKPMKLFLDMQRHLSSTCCKGFDRVADGRNVTLTKGVRQPDGVYQITVKVLLLGNGDQSVVKITGVIELM